MRQCTPATPLHRPATFPVGAALALVRRAPPALQPRALHHQLTASDLEVDTRSKAAMEEAIGDLLELLPRDHVYWRLAARRKSAGPRSLDAVALDLVLLANLGRPEAALRALPRMLDAVVDDLFPAAMARTLDELDVEEAELEGQENLLHALRRAHGETPALNRAEAEINRREALIQLERARLLERNARRQERAGSERMHPEGADTIAPGRITEAMDRARSVRPGGLHPDASSAPKLATAADTRQPVPGAPGQEL